MIVEHFYSVITITCACDYISTILYIYITIRIKEYSIKLDNNTEITFCQWKESQSQVYICLHLIKNYQLQKQVNICHDTLLHVSL